MVKASHEIIIQVYKCLKCVSRRWLSRLPQAIKQKTLGGDEGFLEKYSEVKTLLAHTT